MFSGEQAEVMDLGEAYPRSRSAILVTSCQRVTGDVNLHHLVKVVFCQIFYFRVTIFFPFPFLSFGSLTQEAIF